MLKGFRDSKGSNPELNEKRILDAINRLVKKIKRISYKNIAKEAKCAHNFYLSHPHLKELVESKKAEYSRIFVSNHKRKPSNEIIIKPKEVINAINKLKRENKKITYKAIGSLINENYWNLKERPEIVKIIKPHLTTKAPVKKYFFDEADVLNAIKSIRNEELNISINEVCRKLNCNKIFFRNKPHLKEIILKAKNSTSGGMEYLNLFNSKAWSSLLSASSIDWISLYFSASFIENSIKRYLH